MHDDFQEGGVAECDKLLTLPMNDRRAAIVLPSSNVLSSARCNTAIDFSSSVFAFVSITNAGPNPVE